MWILMQELEETVPVKKLKNCDDVCSEAQEEVTTNLVDEPKKSILEQLLINSG